MFINLSSAQLYYEKEGSGRPLVLVHGNGEDHTIFNEAVQVLKNRFTCYSVDSRGHGESAAADVLHYEDMAADMTEFLEKLDLRDTVFYGFSDGGIIGLLTAAQTDRITSLIVSGANLTPQGVRLPLRIMIRMMYLLKKDDRLRLMLEEPQITKETLHKIGAETLVLAGEKDLVLQKETMYIGAHICRSKTMILPGEGHGSYIVHQTKIAQIINDFIAGPGSPDELGKEQNEIQI